jgi:hypothetical protein
MIRQRSSWANISKMRRGARRRASRPQPSRRRTRAQPSRADEAQRRRLRGRRERPRSQGAPRQKRLLRRSAPPRKRTPLRRKRPRERVGLDRRKRDGPPPGPRAGVGSQPRHCLADVRARRRLERSRTPARPPAAGSGSPGTVCGIIALLRTTFVATAAGGCHHVPYSGLCECRARLHNCGTSTPCSLGVSAMSDILTAGWWNARTR